MKLHIVAFLIAAASVASIASAATGSTSTGSTSTGSTSTGTVVSSGSTSTGSTSTGSTSSGTTSTGTVSTGSTVSSGPSVGGGGPIRAYNLTTKSYDLYPQCFPWAWLLDFYKGNVFMIYENQKACRAQRLIDFGF